MPTRIAHNSKENFKHLVTSKFFALTEWWQEQERRDIVKMCEDYSENELANELKLYL